MLCQTKRNFLILILTFNFKQLKVPYRGNQNLRDIIEGTTIKNNKVTKTKKNNIKK